MVRAEAASASARRFLIFIPYRHINMAVCAITMCGGRQWDKRRQNSGPSLRGRKRRLCSSEGEGWAVKFIAPGQLLSRCHLASDSSTKAPATDGYAFAARLLFRSDEPWYLVPSAWRNGTNRTQFNGAAILSAFSDFLCVMLLCLHWKSLFVSLWWNLKGFLMDWSFRTK
jgi:hypothetical protein